jgi:hypothetical protein
MREQKLVFDARSDFLYGSVTVLSDMVLFFAQGSQEIVLRLASIPGGGER